MYKAVHLRWTGMAGVVLLRRIEETVHKLNLTKEHQEEERRDEKLHPPKSNAMKGSTLLMTLMLKWVK